MKKTFLKRAAYWLFAAGIALTSCSDDKLNDVTGGDNTGGFDESQYEKGYVSMSFINTANTSTLRAAVTEDGTADESKISNALVVLYVDNGGVDEVAYQFDLTETINTPLHTTQAREVAKTDYKVAVFLNFTTDLKDATKKGMTASDMQDAVVALNDVTDFTGAGKDNFLMSNYAGLVAVPTTYIKPTKNEAEANPVHVYVERAVAKVIVGLAAGGVTTNADWTIVGDILWQADVLNKSSYWMRKQTYMLADYTDKDNQTLETSFSGLAPMFRDLMYAEDPNFSKTSWEYWYYGNITGSTIDWSGLTTPPTTANYDAFMKAQYNYIALSDVTNVAIANPTTWVYVPENTMVAEEQWEDATTSVVVKVSINPGETTLTSTSLKDGDSYYTYKSRVFSGAELKMIHDDTYPSGDASSNGEWAKYEALNPEFIGFQKIVKDAITNNAFGITNYATAPTAAAKYKGLAFHLGGINVYNIPIRHYSDALQSEYMKYGRYGVVRNNVYKLTLNKIENFGDIDIPSKDNKDDKSSWIAFQFEILPWVVREQGVDL